MAELGSHFAVSRRATQIRRRPTKIVSNHANRAPEPEEEIDRGFIPPHTGIDWEAQLRASQERAAAAAEASKNVVRPRHRFIHALASVPSGGGGTPRERRHPITAPTRVRHRQQELLARAREGTTHPSLQPLHRKYRLLPKPPPPPVTRASHGWLKPNGTPGLGAFGQFSLPPYLSTIGTLYEEKVRNPCL